MAKKGKSPSPAATAETTGAPDSGAGRAVPATADPDPHRVPPPKSRKRPTRKAKKKAAPKCRETASIKNPRGSSDEASDGLNGVSGLGPEVGPVVDVGSLPTLPSLPASTPAKSVPAVRGSTGVRRHSPLDLYLAEMGKYPLLSPDEERELTLKYFHEGDAQAGRKLVVHNLRLVVKMAYKYRRAWASVLDLIQEGNVGLVEAVGRFDPYKGAKFSTYATFWIRAYMLRYLLEHSRTVRISRTRVGRKLFFQLSRERAKLQAMGIEPGSRLLAERLGVKQEDLEEVARHMDQPEVRLDAPVSGEDPSGGTILDGMATLDVSPEAEAFRREMSDDIGQALESFGEALEDERERVAWERHLLAEDPMSLSELGEMFGVTKQRMGQIVSALRRRLKAHLVRELGPDVELDYGMELE